ncbi:proteasome assembly chaperone 4 [Phlebotomus argentipes]|uniref:proteasome assembly chaperone 4 n=1 Tax=Phlebotomus argentipes TaxID=94469 RepID=UPI0028934DB5|nr:proteasome assembly chaperone 4 [Phlebotomus argentipes]
MPSEPKKFTPQPSSFTTHLFSASASGQDFTYRVLKMQDSTMIYIGEKSSETFEEMALAMISDSGEAVATTILGPLLGCDSQQLAEKVARRLKKQVYISCNVPAERMSRPVIEKHLVDEIKNRPEMF